MALTELAAAVSGYPRMGMESWVQTVSKPAESNQSVLRHAREQRGWTKKYVAGEIGVSEYSVGQWERGKVSPYPESVRKLCQLFEKNAEELGLAPKELDLDQKNTSPPQPRVKPRTRFITHLLRKKSVVFVVLLILIGGILFFILHSLPTADSQIKSVIRSYCQALQVGNYRIAYDLFSKGRKNKETESQFASNQPKSGRITKCLIKHLPQHGSTTAFCICIFVKSDKTEETFRIQFILENNDWKIDDIALSLAQLGFR